MLFQDVQTSIIYLNLNTSTAENSDLQEGYGDYQYYYHMLYIVIVPIVFASMVCFGTLGNTLVIFVILAKKKLQTVTNLLLLNLAVADISFLLICGSFSTVHYALTVWPFSDMLCSIVQYLLYVTCYVTVYTLIAVSAVRYVTVVYGPQTSLIRTKRNVSLLILTIWIVFLIAKIPVLIVHGVSHDPNTNRTECIISGRTDAQNLFASFFVFAYALPLLVIATLYMLILCHLKHRKDVAVHRSAANGERTRHVTKIVILVVMVFAVCWLPLHIHLLVAYYGTLPTHPVYYAFLILWHCLAFGNSVLNPIIYNLLSADFRNAFREVICCQKGVIMEGTSV